MDKRQIWFLAGGYIAGQIAWGWWTHNWESAFAVCFNLLVFALVLTILGRASRGRVD